MERVLNSKQRLLLGCAGFMTLLLLCVPVLTQSDNGAVATPISAPSYRVGERLTYNVSFSNFPTAAHAELQVVNRGNFYGRDGIELRAHVKTSASSARRSTQLMTISFLRRPATDFPSAHSS